jgi:anti-anti-sigma factor
MPDLLSTVHHQDGITTLSLTGRLDESTAPSLGATIDEIVESKPQHVDADLAGLDQIDSSGVAALVGLYKRVRAEGGTFKVINARDQPMAILELLRMDKVFL